MSLIWRAGKGAKLIGGAFANAALILAIGGLVAGVVWIFTFLHIPLPFAVVITYLILVLGIGLGSLDVSSQVKKGWAATKRLGEVT